MYGLRTGTWLHDQLWNCSFAHFPTIADLRAVVFAAGTQFTFRLPGIVLVPLERSYSVSVVLEVAMRSPRPAPVQFDVRIKARMADQSR